MLENLPLLISPEGGDITWADLDPTLGREQQKRRPVLVLAPAQYHLKTSLAIIVPITSQIKGYRFEVPLPSDCLASSRV